MAKDDSKRNCLQAEHYIVTEIDDDAMKKYPLRVVDLIRAGLRAEYGYAHAYLKHGEYQEEREALQ
jgi:hypothetical protein